MKRLFAPLAFVLASGFFVGCGGSEIDAPEITPIVSEAAPTSLKQNASDVTLLSTLDGRFAPLVAGGDIQDRFFKTGPSSIYDRTEAVDSRVNELKTRASESERECLSNTPVEMTTTYVDQTLTAYFQCYDDLGDDEFFAFGKNDDTWYLYEYSGQAIALYVIVPNGSNYTVTGYVSIGRQNASSSSCSSSWDGCSYGTVNFAADSGASTFEMAVAGVGLGFCGYHVKSDGTYVWGEGSENATGTTCETSSQDCYNASGLTDATGQCGSIDTDDFTLTAQGRTAVTGHSVSDWPGSPNVTTGGTSGDEVQGWGWRLSDITAQSGIGAF